MSEPGKNRQALESGYRLGKYRIVSVLGSGGFGITYLAYDLENDRDVAIKELLPASFAKRSGGIRVVAREPDLIPEFEWAKRRFIDEGKALWKCLHPSVVEIFETFEANGTAYLVTRFIEGETMTGWLHRLGRPATERELKRMMRPLLAGLELVHSKGFLHRDIKPDNIFVTSSGYPILLDFGSARMAIGRRSQTLTSIITPGYSPFEQYPSDQNQEHSQGPWTDMYALAGVLLAAITGVAPPDVTTRMLPRVSRKHGALATQRDLRMLYSEDFLEAIDRISEMDLDGRFIFKRDASRRVNLFRDYSQGFLQSIDWAFSLNPRRRPQSIQKWRRRLLDSTAGWNRPLGKEGPLSYLLSKTREYFIPRFSTSPKEPKRLRAVTHLLVGTLLVAIVSGIALLSIQPGGALSGKLRPVEGVSGSDGPEHGGLTGKDENEAESGKVIYKNSENHRFVAIPGTSVLFAIEETSRAQFRRFAEETGFAQDTAESGHSILVEEDGSWLSNPSATWDKGMGLRQEEDHPVAGLNWNDCQAYLKWLNESDSNLKSEMGAKAFYRLPTDQEWTIALAMPDLRDEGDFPADRSLPDGTHLWPAGDDPAALGYAVNRLSTMSGGKGVANTLGLRHLIGNVQEWCEDPFFSSDTSTRLLRGGGFIAEANGAICDYCVRNRKFAEPYERRITYGFRVAIER